MAWYAMAKLGVDLRFTALEGQPARGDHTATVRPSPCRNTSPEYQQARVFPQE